MKQRGIDTLKAPTSTAQWQEEYMKVTTELVEAKTENEKLRKEIEQCRLALKVVDAKRKRQGG